ncbi:hypothetical protein LSH36_118g06012 [Paralvinella palmiformis]|uniref:Uncharacterized protein n=1 Tax=Paralvinella palmiformis TaxID=53620 RepID=A0AAD9JXS4_9ANNE|nr:hypothetical protein LSH36_118g06012 [Paralvinella palmiformis]
MRGGVTVYGKKYPMHEDLRVQLVVGRERERESERGRKRWSGSGLRQLTSGSVRLPTGKNVTYRSVRSGPIPKHGSTTAHCVHARRRRRRVPKSAATYRACGHDELRILRADLPRSGSMFGMSRSRSCHRDVASVREVADSSWLEVQSSSLVGCVPTHGVPAVSRRCTLSVLHTGTLYTLREVRDDVH